MGRLQDIVVGTRAIKRVDYPLVNCPSVLTEPAAELQQARAADIAAANATAETYPTHDTVGMRVLLPGEFATVLERTLAFCKARGEEKPDPDTSPIYNLGMQIYTLAAACVDPDSPRKPDGTDNLYFGDSIDDAAAKIQSCEHMTRDTLTYLSQIWEDWCEHCNPQASKVDYWSILEGTAADADFLHFVKPGTLFNFLRISSVALVSLPEAKLLFGSFSTENLKTHEPKPTRTKAKRK